MTFRRGCVQGKAQDLRVKICTRHVRTNDVYGVRGTYAELDIPNSILSDPTLFDDDISFGLSRLTTESLDFFDDFESFDHLTEHDVISIKPAGLFRRNEKLGSISVRTRISHR